MSALIASRSPETADDGFTRLFDDVVGSDAEASETGVVGPRRRRKMRARRLRVTGVVGAVAIAVVAALLRLFEITTSYDLFIDEATYAAIARDSSLATGPLLHGLPFVLHPPLGLLMLAGPADWIGTSDVAALVAGLRPVVAVVGALTAAVVFLTLHQAGLRVAAFAAALLVALDPFTISFDSRVMLEAFAQFFAVLTIASAIRTVTADRRTRWRWALATAAAGAATFGTKETFGLVILATLFIVALTAPRGDRRVPLLAVAGTLVGYALVNVVMIDWSDFALWWHMRTDGLSRLLGLQHPTGFKAEGVQTPFWDRLLPNGAELAATYAILAVGGLCALSLLWAVVRRRPLVTELPPRALAAVRVISIWAFCACGYVAYAVAFGSLEEQMFYIAVVPCAMALSIRVFLISRRVARRAAVAGVAVIALVQGIAWVNVHTTPDDVYAQVLDRIDSVAPAGSSIAVTEETGQFVVTGFDLGQWSTAQDLLSNRVDFVLMSERLVTNGYGLADEAFAAEVREHGTLVLSATGRKSDLQLYDVRQWTTPEVVGVSMGAES